MYDNVLGIIIILALYNQIKKKALNNLSESKISLFSVTEKNEYIYRNIYKSIDT